MSENRKVTVPHLTAPPNLISGLWSTSIQISIRRTISVLTDITVTMFKAHATVDQRPRFQITEKLSTPRSLNKIGGASAPKSGAGRDPNGRAPRGLGSATPTGPQDTAHSHRTEHPIRLAPPGACGNETVAQAPRLVRGRITFGKWGSPILIPFRSPLGGQWPPPTLKSQAPPFPSPPRPSTPPPPSPPRSLALTMAAAHQVSAVIFDMDGTILDTERATRDVLHEFLEAYGKVPDPEKEEKRLGQMYTESTTGIIKDYGLPLTLEEYSEAMYPLYLKRWKTAKPLPGVKRLVKHLHKNGVPLAIASNSVRRNIDHKLPILEDWRDCFSVILGGDQVPNGKPAPDIFLEAAKRLGVNPSSCLVIEDSVVGVKGAKASGAKVVAVPSLQTQRKHYCIADAVLYSLLDFSPELWGLPPFEDRIQGVLRIDPLPSNAQIGDKILNNLFWVNSDASTYDCIPDQISGIFIGWTKSKVHGFSKVVVSTGWDFSQKIVQRVMHVDFLDPSGMTEKEHTKLLVIGYIRKLQSTDDVLQALSITDEDKCIARDALDLPTFSEYANDIHFA